MVKIQEHNNRILEIKNQLRTAKGFHKKDLIKHLRKLEKELLIANHYLKGVSNEKFKSSVK